MSMFQCEHCGSAENTALCSAHMLFLHSNFDFSGIEDRRGKRLCSACAPSAFSKGGATGYGIWHSKFPRVFLEIGEWMTNRQGNLERKADGETDYLPHALRIENGTDT